jgi:hypothetical protein
MDNILQIRVLLESLRVPRVTTTRSAATKNPYLPYRKDVTEESRKLRLEQEFKTVKITEVYKQPHHPLIKKGAVEGKVV